MKITYRHYRFPAYLSGIDQFLSVLAQALDFDMDQFTGRHGTAYHYQRGLSGWEPTPRGGYTLCTIYDDDGIELISSVAECSHLDPFNYKLGREIAKGRIIKRLFVWSDSEFIHEVFLGLGWTKQTKLSDFVDEQARLFRRFFKADYSLLQHIMQ